ncbi:MAG: hypothetical protein ACRYGP_25625 [Janthinobacterium lividum]
MTAAEALYQKSQQCRRLMRQTTDQRTIEALRTLAAEYDDQAHANHGGKGLIMVALPDGTQT